ncbi:hypothetical protein TrLO_g8128 [Triparma laevis f. longispina]|uniref:Uncharacterized protein n=1 Tax=Triparma laevis f. longispina TaxID=1714387 RepID=A0A9W7C4T7_9STRA|nr:hypothetical protein TrLO_g8128 [Triparma laevis f. longispina]
MLRNVLLILSTACIDSHYIWQTISDDLSSTSLTFSEHAGSPGAHFFLSSLKDKLSIAQATADGSTIVPFLEKRDGATNGEFLATLPSSVNPPYALETACPYGIFTEAGPTALLQYYTSSPQITTPNDWFEIQDLLKNTFEVTLRDPYMSMTTKDVSSSVGLKEGLFEDECPSGENSVDGMACVVAVVRFNGELHSSAVNVTTFDESGETISTTECESVCIMKVPMSGAVFAAAQYKEMTPGTFDGTDYEYVDHWATTYTVVKRD